MLAFASLRAAARGDCAADDVELARVAPHLGELRRGALVIAAVVRAASRAPTALETTEFVALVHGVWGSLASLPPSHDAAPPPLYPTKAITEALRFAAVAMLAAECGQRSAASANAIYSGVRGTGKSTLLRAMGACAAVLLERVLPVAHNYEEAGGAPAAAPSELMACALESFYAGPGVPAVVAATAAALRGDGGMRLTPLEGLKALASVGHAPLLLLDEFAVLYPLLPGNGNPPGSAAAAAARGGAVMTAVHTLCKSGRDVVALLAMSRTDVKGLIHPDTTAALLPARRLLGYPDLNSQVFTPRAVRPIRDTGQLALYVQKRHGVKLLLLPPAAAPTTAPCDGGLTAAAVLHATGGCGRLVAQLLASGSVAPPIGADDIMRDTPLFAVCCALLSYAPPGLRGAEEAWPVWGMPEREAIDVACAATVGFTGDGGPAARRLEAMARISDWRDQGIFYLNERGGLEPLVPAVLASVNARVTAADALHRARVLVQTLQGFDGGSAGRSNEALLCEGVAAAMALRHVDGDGGLLLLAEGTGGGAFTAARLGTAAPMTAIDDALGALLRWRLDGHETGVDRIWLTRAAGGGAVKVGLLQVKSGAVTARLTAGRLASQRAKRKASHVDDATIAGILVRAERGVGELLPALAAAFPDVTFELDRFCLYSTKAAQSATDKFAQSHPVDAEELHIALPADQMRRLRAAIGVAADDDVTLPWSVTDGLEWVRGVLPATVNHLLAGFAV
jgi:hypothetical protein